MSLDVSANSAAEPRLGMGAARRYFYKLTGHMPGLSSMHRWRLKGRLYAVMIGGRFYTTESAIRAMLPADEQRNRGSSNTRGEAAAARLAAILDGDARGEVA